MARAVYPGLTANYDAGRFRALGIAAAELLEHGAEYAAPCIEAARALGPALHDGLHVAGADRGFTESHHVAIAWTRCGRGRPARPGGHLRLRRRIPAQRAGPGAASRHPGARAARLRR